MLVSFDIVTMFPSIDNESGLQALINVLEVREEQFVPTLWIFEALKLCLKCNNSIFNKKYFLQNDSFAQGLHVSCSCGDIAIEQFDKKALEYNPAVIGFNIILQLLVLDDIFLVWPHSEEDLNFFFNYMNNIDRTKKIQFTMEVTKDVSEFLDLKLKFDKECKLILVDIFAKANNSFTYVLPNTFFLKNSIENMLHCD